MAELHTIEAEVVNGGEGDGSGDTQVTWQPSEMEQVWTGVGRVWAGAGRWGILGKGGIGMHPSEMEQVWRAVGGVGGGLWGGPV